MLDGFGMAAILPVTSHVRSVPERLLRSISGFYALFFIAQSSILAG
jgi:hypothetical protein